MSVCVLTDPSAVVPSSWSSDLPLRRVPLDIAWPDGTTEPGDAPFSHIAARLTDPSMRPTTGAPSPGVYEETIRKLLEAHDGVVVVCPSSEMSTTFQSARLGAEQTGDARVRVLDSRTAAAGQGLVAAEAARSAATGGTLDGVSARAGSVASDVRIWATLSQLDFLRRSGRVPAVAAVGAGALDLHPVIRYAGGSPNVVGVVRGAARGADRLFAAWQRSLLPRGAVTCVAFHAQREQDATTLVDRIVTRYPAARAGVAEVSASLGAHTGAGLLGLAWFWDVES